MCPVAIVVRETSLRVSFTWLAEPRHVFLIMLALLFRCGGSYPIFEAAATSDIDALRGLLQAGCNKVGPHRQSLRTWLWRLSSDFLGKALRRAVFVFRKKNLTWCGSHAGQRRLMLENQLAWVCWKVFGCWRQAVCEPSTFFCLGRSRSEQGPGLSHLRERQLNALSMPCCKGSLQSAWKVFLSIIKLRSGDNASSVARRSSTGSGTLDG